MVRIKRTGFAHGRRRGRYTDSHENCLISYRTKESCPHDIALAGGDTNKTAK